MTHQDILNLNPKHAELGFGLMRLPSTEETAKMVDMYIEAGFNYFDTAYVYGGSEDKLKRALSDRHPRDAFLVADKIPPWMARDQKTCDKLLKESLGRCGLDYFDFYLVHSLDDGNEKSAVRGGVYEWAARQKEKGLCRHIGFSFHGSTELLEHILTVHPEMEFVQLQLNYMDILRGKAGELHEVAQKHKKPIIIMEPVKGGTLASLPPVAEAFFKRFAPNSSVASWAIRYAASLSGASCVLSGMSNIAQMEDNLKTYSPFVPISKDEQKIIENVLTELSMVATIPCTYCKYCVAACPQDIEIPVCFNLYNDSKRGAAQWNLEGLYNSIPSGHRAGDCVECGDCVARCPQHIDIPKELKNVSRHFS
ncbi:MAG: aldo/keto reductase [Oscillospiraceae bacterium]|nr:aldo/keto reductase [Oscillospiraceae bacterium]